MNVSGNSYAGHRLQVVDMNGDRRMDVIGEVCGYKMVSYYENCIDKGLD